MISSTYTSLYHQWLAKIRENENQLEAFRRSRHTVVIAGPGSGKTRILAIKMAQLLRDEISSPKGIACLTFTRMMAKELETRLTSLEVLDRPNVVIGTVHSFCLGEIVYPFAQIFNLGLPLPIRIASKGIVDSCLDEARRKVSGISYNPEKDGRFKNELKKYHLQRADIPFENWDHQKFAMILQTYYQFLCERGYVDFDLIVRSALTLISQYDLVRQSLFSKFAWLAVDEYQDLGYPLFRIVTEMIDHTAINLFAIGDPDQSIFDFAGTDPRYLIELTERPEMHPPIKLGKNYRSKTGIATVSKAILSPYAEYVAEKEGGVCHIFETMPDSQGKTAAKLAQSYLNRGIPRERIAILHPLREKGINKIARDLQSAKIEFMLDKNPFYDRSMNLIRWLEDLGSWCLEGWNTEICPTEKKTLDELVNTYNHILHPLTADRHLSSEERLNLTKFIWSIKGEDMLFSSWLSLVMNRLGLAQDLQEYKRIYPDEVDELAHMQQIAQSGNKLGGMHLGKFVNLTRGIQLTTLHSSKGMEFEVVIIAGTESIKNDENGKRLFYVGVTRAESEVCLLYSKVQREWNPQIPVYIKNLVKECGHLQYFHHYPLTEKSRNV